ncbi:pyruvate:ferredoxin (flavodoxin) oxidoreductase [Gemmiger formicilis]|uniref:pyruvate:ferredoxin (flavodoxin) oxidoreductase n=1 Tax=Gemmiger formicilis TaxID=745368 RepID=UPI00210D43A5|nr:pyruvate:ferredoxin (flavodoxin) oxidoreductase [Gemmiger formicilis]MCQ5080003.1 pyruvate:ferredoxin (flavodoxin) oxidoreductase [Gemmiger formicilis]MCQ5117251.1 pyruvate:ferredoxin (flavodoxin) oxidoreductase [Gemmiger formicilis]
MAKKKTMDGNEAAAYASYAFTEIAAIYPITPSSPMADHVDTWAASGMKNIFGQSVKLVEMQSEAGAVSAMHGALDSGSLGTSYTASQGMMLMIPTMYRIAGELKPAVIHAASRNVATNNISIFAEHSDVMACRQTGFALLASSNVQECMDIGAVAHLSAIKGHVPFLHFFDGFRTSHEIQKIDVLDFNDLAKLVDYEELEKFRKRSLNPERPLLRTAGLNADTYFQCREAMNPYYDALPEIVEEYMGKMSELTGREYHCVNYYGDPEAEYVLVGMGSVAETAAETIDYLRAQGKKVGYVNVHLYRPFPVQYLLNALPATVKAVTVLDRTKEPGATGEPLYEDVCSVLKEFRSDLPVYACRFGLACKDTTPAQIVAMYENMTAAEPANHYTIGIDDDVTHRSLAVGKEINIVPAGTCSCKFWGLGSDGTVGANKNTIKIIGDHTDKYVQAYFEYDGKKSGGVTKSHLRFGDEPIRSSYLVRHADFVACHNKAYVANYDMVSDLKEGGSFLLACDWADVAALDAHLPVSMRRAIARKHINLYVIDSVAIAAELGLGNRTNTILQAAFFHITGIIPDDKAVEYMKAAALKSYGKKGEKVVNMNYAAVDRGICGAVKIDYPASWADLADETPAPRKDVPEFVTKILEPVNNMHGDELPVSAFVGLEDGTWPQATSKYEKRGVAVKVPAWDASKCVQCNQCSYVCPHAAIRPFLLTEEEVANAPEKMEVADTKPKASEYKFRLQTAVLDCQGCGSCVTVCPTKAITMEPLDTQRHEEANWEYIDALPEVRNTYGDDTVKGSQFNQPLLEFNGSCAGCGETPYAKLVTQLFGDHMYIATATGCSQVWATSFPSFPYCTNKKGFGPALGGSLFENNAEFGMGISLSVEQQRAALRTKVEELMSKIDENSDLYAAAKAWDDNFNVSAKSEAVSDALKAAVTGAEVPEDAKEALDYVQRNAEHLRKKSVWIFGGDGWAYDIGYGGLDHVISTGANVNIMVFDTEVYSNTGGQASKSSPRSAVAQFAAAGKRTKKKDLGMMAMSYRDVYVAQVAMGANPAQLLRAVKEAESYDGPSIVICYSPCINHGLRAGMANVMTEMKNAVNCGYWQLYRYDPRLIDAGKNPFQLDSKEPTGDYQSFLQGEVRYSSLARKFPDLAPDLYAKSEQDAKERYAGYKVLAEEK